MRRRVTGVAGRNLLGVAILGLAGVIQPASAQDIGGVVRDRTGPLAQPQSLPDYAEPAANPLPQPPPPAFSPPEVPATVVFDRVTVSVEGPGTALPQPGWTPASDPATGMTLSPTGPGGFSADWVEAQFRGNGMIGSATNYARVVALVQLVNRAFLANGFANSGVLVAPQQTDSGTLALRLVNGRIGSGQGADGMSISFAEGRANGLTPGFIEARMPSAGAVPFNAFALERDFRLLAADPAVRTLDARLRPGVRPGEALLDVIVDPESRFDLYGLVANNRSPTVGGIRWALGASLRNALVGGDIMAAEAGTTDGLDDGLLSYAGPVFGPRTRLLLRGAINDAAVVEPRLQALDITSREWSAEGGIAHTLVDTPLIPDGNRWQAARNVSIGALVAHRRTTTRLLDEPFSFSPGAVDGRAEYTALRLTQDFVERGVRHVLAVSLTETLGIEGTRPDVAGVVSPKKHFTAVLLQATFARRLGEAFELNLRMAGQYSGGTLYSGERFSVGGENSVRGYRENLLLADRGLFGSIELAYNFSLTGPDRRGFDWGAFRVSAFLDGAVADNSRAPEPLPKSVASLGASLAWRPSDAITARITYGEALRKVRFPGEHHLQDKGVQFRIAIHPLKLF